MGMSERRKRQLEDRRRRIMECAHRLFRDAGYDSITMQDIADAAEVSKGSLYLQFRDKEDLMLALVLDSFDRLEDLVRREAAPPGTGFERLNRLAHAYSSHALQEQGRKNNFWLMAKLSLDPQSETQVFVRERIERLNAIVEGVYEEGKADKSVRPDIEARTIIHLFTLVLTTFVERLSQFRTFLTPVMDARETDLVEEFIGLFLYYVRPAGSESRQNS